MVDAEVNRQAAMIAYIDDFYLMMWMSFLTVPLVFFMRRADVTTRIPPSAEDRAAQAADTPH